VVGKHCESGDVVVADARVPADTAVGDVLATPVTGAYGYSMASNYNKVPRPAVVFVADGAAPGGRAARDRRRSSRRLTTVGCRLGPVPEIRPAVGGSVNRWCQRGAGCSRQMAPPR
jgi:hypothetical protein